jgi:hypothetical protein
MFNEMLAKWVTYVIATAYKAFCDSNPQSPICLGNSNTESAEGGIDPNTIPSPGTLYIDPNNHPIPSSSSSSLQLMHNGKSIDLPPSDVVRAAYFFYLGRPPENELVIHSWASHLTNVGINKLGEDISNSSEAISYRRKNVTELLSICHPNLLSSEQLIESWSDYLKLHGLLQMREVMSHQSIPPEY